MRRFALLILLFLSTTLSFSQNKELGAWYMYFGTFKFTDKLSLHNETQWRQFKIAGDFQQSLTRLGINYHINKNNMITGGYGFIRTRFPFSSPLKNIMGYDQFSNEHRIWQQYVQKHKLNRIYFDHRFRLEQQFINKEGVQKYNNRARYRIGVAIPITNKELVDNTLFFYWYDEIFLNISNTPFSQNRFYIALGYRLKNNLSIQGGYLWWYTSQLNNRIQLGIFYNLDFRKGE